uniref:receptor protein-tyrosine kinase n=1 Tax=Phallusia mammillata TaxID=59560 RepID=A0A6F9DCV4_9ASCI|nr:Eph3 ephrin receptor precursor [Phallusia mammillata]
MYLFYLLLLWSLNLLASQVHADTHVLYNTKTATSDLLWTLNPDQDGWEELSGLDVDKSTIRYHQVCNTEEHGNNWARSPFIDAKSAKRIYIDIEFSVMKCPKCRETFTLFYYPSSSNVASSTFPPWRENPYIKIDTVAAGERFESADAGPNGINKKTLVIGPLKRRGLYIAAQDQGACMSIMSVKLYYNFCPETTHNLAYFPKTVAGGEVASLVSVDGKCVSNAVYKNNEVPKYRCNSNGDWTVPTGACQCRAGYEPSSDSTACQACPVGYYKSAAGNHPCSPCPNSSLSNAPRSTFCVCKHGYFRAPSDSLDQPCFQPPSKPQNVTYVVDKCSVSLRWSEPASSGKRDDLYYSVTCQQCKSQKRDCVPCPDTVDYTPARPKHLTQTSLAIADLDPFSYYVITVTSLNGVTSESSTAPAYQSIEFATSEAVPSVVNNLVLVASGKTSLTIQWAPPTKPNGLILDYEVQAAPVEKSGEISAPIKKQIASHNVTIEGLASGETYVVKIRARTSAGFGQFSQPLSYTTLEEAGTGETIVSEGSSTILIIIIVAAVALIAIAAVLCIMRRRKLRLLKEADIRARSKLPDNEQLIVRDEFSSSMGGRNARKTYVDYRDPHKGVKEIAREIEVSKIKIDRVIGRGEFGEVCKGKLVEGRTSVPVAVKRLKHGASLIDQTNFLREACTMAQFEDSNIVQLQGVVTKSVPAMILTEFMDNGSLDKFLQRMRGELSMVQLLQMLKGIASGMRYLSSMKYVHRDLAARNILVNSDLGCKVSDFGLSRTLENDPHATYTTQGGKIALRWTAPECIRYRQFTSLSDVWSFGIVMWEVMSYGEKPYWDMSNDDVTEVIEDGYRLPAPSGCPQALHNLMLQCWSYEPRRRPSFNEILAQLDDFIRQPSLLNDDMSATDQSAPLLNPDSPTSLQEVTTLEEWLDMVKLGRYRQSFYAHGIVDLETLAHLSSSDLERFGISSSTHLNRLQGGLDTLRRHLSTGSAAEGGMAPHLSNTMRPSSDVTTNPSARQSFTLPPQRQSPQREPGSRDVSVAIV